MQTSTELVSTHLIPKDLTPRQVAGELGLAYDTVRRLLQAGLLPGYKAGRRAWRIRREELDQFKASGGVRPQGRPRKDEADNG
jgi:excisionase family DNA binding protein